MFSFEFCEIFKNTYFYWTTPVAASELSRPEIAKQNQGLPEQAWNILLHSPFYIPDHQHENLQSIKKISYFIATLDKKN